MSALSEAPVRPYVLKHGDRELRNLFQAALEAYAGPRGLLGMHRLKLYGFMELGFRAGRNITAGEFSGTVAQRAWEILDDEIEHARRERYIGLSMECATARRVLMEPAGDGEASPVRRVALDVSETGLRFAAGDRVAVLGGNAPELVEKTLAALRARPDAPLALTADWRAHLRYVTGHDPGEAVVLETFLTYAKIRPLVRSVAKQLYGLIRLPAWNEILEAREEEHWELWDFLELLEKAPYDPRRLWKARSWSRENLSQILPPETFRIYSISSAPTERVSKRLDLTVGALSYTDRPDEKQRRGVGSHFLTGARGAGERIPLRLMRPSRFHLPEDASAPDRPLRGRHRDFSLSWIPSGPRGSAGRRGELSLHRHTIAEDALLPR